MLLTEIRHCLKTNLIGVQFHYIHNVGCALFNNPFTYSLVFFISYSNQDRSMFAGDPNVNCKGLAPQIERRQCKNVPECKDEV